MGDLHLSIKGDPAGLYDPDRGVLTGQAPLIGTPLLRTDQFFEPFLGNSQWPNHLDVTLTLAPGEDDSWPVRVGTWPAVFSAPREPWPDLDDGAGGFPDR